MISSLIITIIIKFLVIHQKNRVQKKDKWNLKTHTYIIIAALFFLKPVLWFLMMNQIIDRKYTRIPVSQCESV